MNKSIVINREFGSGGREIGHRIADRTGMEFYDSRILQEAATKKGLPHDLLASFDERLSSGPFYSLSLIGGVDLDTASLPYRAHAAISDVIIAAAQRAPAVFIGRCADRILAEAGLPFRNVFVYCTDMQRKIDRAVNLDGVAPKHAESYIAKMDKARSRYQQFFFDTTFGDYRTYDLCLDSAVFGEEGCVDLILASLDHEAPKAATAS